MARTKLCNVPAIEGVDLAKAKLLLDNVSDQKTEDMALVDVKDERRKQYLQPWEGRIYLLS
jgi:hypothetical protein